MAVFCEVDTIETGGWSKIAVESSVNHHIQSTVIKLSFAHIFFDCCRVEPLRQDYRATRYVSRGSYVRYQEMQGTCMHRHSHACTVLYSGDKKMSERTRAISGSNWCFHKYNFVVNTECSLLYTQRNQTS